jgi:hypothetical protein
LIGTGLPPSDSSRSVTLDYRRRLTATPNDALYGTGQAYLRTVRLDKAWDLRKDATTAVIAIVDTGVLATHPDLVGKMVAGYNVVAPGTVPTDTLGHGTMVAGIAAANTGNAAGVAGAAWNGRIMPVKVFQPDGTAFDSDVAAGIVWAADHGAKVINLSLGGPGDGTVLHDAIRYAIGKGAVVVAASGNTGDGTPMYPAAYSEVISVAATDAAGAVTDFSSWGPGVDLAAPGVHITSTYLGNTYAVGDGTSFAAPIVAGIAAIVRAKYPTWTPAEVANRLESRARDAGPRGLDPYYRYGIVDAYRVLGGAWTTDFAQAAPGVGEPNDVPERATLVGASATGTIGFEGDVDWYRHDSVAAETLTVTVTPTAYDANRAQNVDPVLDVYDADLRLLGTMDTPILAEPETLTLVVGGGAHYIRVHSYNGAADTRPYTLTVTNAAGGLFQAPQAISVGSRPAGVAVADVTGDGQEDVVLTTTYAGDAAADNSLFVFARNLDGTLAAPVRRVPTQASLTGSLAVLDATADGYTDVAVAGAAGVAVFHQAGGSLVAGPELAGTAGATQVAAHDMDSDGDADLVVARSTGITLLTNTAGGFAATSVTTDTSAEVEIGDVDGDARPDVVGFSGGLVRVYHRTDTGWQRTEHDTVRGPSGSIDGIEVADVSGDGLDDIIATIGGNPPSSRLNVFRQTLDGTLTTPDVYATKDVPEPVETADVDGDGRLDVVTAHGGFATVSLLLQNASGLLGTPVESSVPNSSHYQPQGLALGDVDGDTRPDVVLADPTGGLVVLRQGTGLAPAGEQAWVRDVAPADSAAGVALATAPRLTFQRALDPASVTAATVRLVHGRTGATVPAAVAYDPTTHTVTLTPTAPLQDNTPYRIVASGVLDGVGSELTDGFSTTFRTQDVGPAALSGMTVAGGIGTATLTWPKPAITDQDAVIIRMAAGATAPASPTTGTAVYTGIGTTVMVTGLPYGTSYSFAAWVKDRSGKLSPAATFRLVGTTVSVAANVTSVKKGAAVTVSTRLVRPDTGAGVAGEGVRIDYRRKGTTTWVPLVTLTTGANGTASYKHTPAWTVEYRWRYRGSTVYLGSGSATRAVTVA